MFKNTIKVIVSLFIGLYALNIGIGMSNSSIRKDMDYYNGQSSKQKRIMFSNSNEKMVTPENFVLDIAEVVKEKSLFINGQEINDGNMINSSYFVNNNFYSKPMIKEGEFLSIENIDEGNKVVLGELTYKEYFGDKKFESGMKIKINNHEFEIVGIAYSMFKNSTADRVSRSYYFSIKDFDKIYPHTVKAEKPMYFEFIVEGNNIEEDGQAIMDKIKDIFTDKYIGLGYVEPINDYVKNIDPSPKIVSAFSIFILIFTILTIWAVTNLLIEQNYKNFAVMKALGANENMIAIDFIKSFVFKYLLIGILSYLCFLITNELLIRAFDFKLYPMINNLIFTLLSSIVVSIISFIKPFLKIRKLNLVEYLKTT